MLAIANIAIWSSYGIQPLPDDNQYTASLKEFPKMPEAREAVCPLWGRGGACDDGGGRQHIPLNISAGRVTKERESFPLP